MICPSTVPRNFLWEQSIIRGTEVPIMQSVRQSDILRHGCTTKVATSIIMNTGLTIHSTEERAVCLLRLCPDVILQKWSWIALQRVRCIWGRLIRIVRPLPITEVAGSLLPCMRLPEKIWSFYCVCWQKKEKKELFPISKESF